MLPSHTELRPVGVSRSEAQVLMSSSGQTQTTHDTSLVVITEEIEQR